MITDKELFKLIDGDISPSEREILERKVESDSNLKNRFTQLRNMHAALGTSPLVEPSPSFTSNVMSNLAKRLSPRMSASRPVRTHMFVAILVVAVVFVAALVLLSKGSLGGLLPDMQLQTISLNNRSIDVNPGNWINQDLFFKGLIYLNAFLGILLIERAVMRPFFQQRRQRMSF